jgi:hypothetical protein
MAQSTSSVNVGDPGHQEGGEQAGSRPAPLWLQVDERSVADRALVVWSAGKARLDSQKSKTYLKRLLNGLERIQ